MAVLIFAGTFRSRIQLAVTNRTLLAFPLNRDFADYSAYMVSRRAMLYYRSLQSGMEAGTNSLVWVVAPFHLDFSRNRIFTVTEPGLINPTLQFPAGADLNSLRSYLRKWGVRYILIETIGTEVQDVTRLKPYLSAQHSVYQKLGDYGIYFRTSLLALAERSHVLYSDRRMLLFELDDAGKRPSPGSPPSERTGILQ